MVDTGFDTGESALTALTFPANTYALLEHHAPYHEIFAIYRVLSITWLTRAAGEFSNEIVKTY
jgi:AraC family transcriptional regulator